jgi:ATP-binding cassette subfamily B protein
VSESTGNNQRMSRRILGQLRPFWPAILVLLAVDLLATPLLLLTPIPLKIAVDSVIGTEPLPGFIDAFVPASVVTSGIALLVVVAVLQVLIVLLSELQALISYVLQTRTGERLTLDFRGRLFRHVQRLSLSFHDTRGSHESIYRIQYDAEAMQHIVESVIPFVGAAAMLVSALYVTALIDLQLALIALAVVPALFLLSRVYTRRVHRRYHDLKELESSALGVLQDVLTSMRVVKAFGKERDEHARYVARSDRTVRARVRLSFTEAGFGLAVNVAIAIGTAAVLFVGVRHVQTGVLTVGELLIVMAYLSQLYGPMETISQKVGDLQSSLASAERAFELRREGEASCTAAPPGAGRDRVSGRLLRLRRPDLGSPRHLVRDSGRHASRHRRQDGGRQDDAGESHHALLRSHGGRDPARRRRPARLQARRPPQSVRDRAPGAGALLDERRREHRLWQAGGSPARRHRSGGGRKRA